MGISSTPKLPPTSLQGLVAGVARNAVEAAKASGAVPQDHATATATDAFAGDATGLMGLPEEGLNQALESAFGAFDEESAFSGIDPSVPLGQGVAGMEANVRALQAGLNAMGASPALTVDGQYGPGTAAAVAQFQSTVGLPATGEAGTETMFAMSAVEFLASATLAEGDPQAQAASLEGARQAMALMPEGSVPPELEAMVAELEAYVGMDGTQGQGFTEEELAQDLVMTPEGSLAEESGQSPAEDPALDALAARNAESARAQASVDRFILPDGAERPADPQAEAAVAEVEAADSEGDLLALVTPEWVAAAPTAAVERALTLLSDDFFINNEEAGAMGRLTARLASVNPDSLPDHWAALQDGAGSNNERAFAEAFLETCSDGLRQRLVESQPAVMRDFLAATDGGLLTAPTYQHHLLEADLRRASQLN